MQKPRLEQLLAMLENEPDDPFLKYAIATEYVKLDDKENALLYYTNLVTNHSDYVGTYYHLGKLYEKLSAPGKAEAMYRKGIEVARAARDKHAASELQSALDELMEA